MSEIAQKLTDTPLNKWVKGLDREKKRQFHQNVIKSELLWSEDKEKENRRLAFNNYRKIEIKAAPHTSKIPIYIAALSVDPKLNIWDIFPEITPVYIGKYMPIIRVFAENFNSFCHDDN